MSGLVETASGPPEEPGKKKKRSLVRVELPGDDVPILGAAEATAEALEGRHVFFRRGEAVIFPSPTGEAKMLPMTAIVFRSAIERYVEYFKTRSDESGNTWPVVRSLNNKDAETILFSSAFWPRLPEIKRVHPCPLPVLRPGGKVEMLEPGYDVATGIYTFPG